MKPYQINNTRKSSRKIDNLFLNRWSPRSLSNDNFTENMLLELLEAARWAPSSSNIQPWRFLFSLNGSKTWPIFFDLLVDFNKLWCKDAGALVVICSKTTTNEGNINRTHSFDTGAAWMSLALQARMSNLIAHGMAGFDYDKAHIDLKIPKDFQVEAMVAVGTQSDISKIPERMQKNEKPNSRVPLSEIAYKDHFPENKN
jgi:nitroreductase